MPSEDPEVVGEPLEVLSHPLQQELDLAGLLLDPEPPERERQRLEVGVETVRRGRNDMELV